MKKSLVIFCIFSIILNSLGLGIAYHFAKKSAKKEIIKKIELFNDTSLYEKIDINESDSSFKFVEEDEFVYQGKLYDIVSYSKTNGKYKFVCICDDKENESIKTISGLVKKALNDDADSASQKIKKVISSLIDYASIYEIEYNNDYYTKIEKYNDIFNSTIKYYYEIPNPPPEI